MTKKIFIFSSRTDLNSTAGGSSIRIEGLTKFLNPKYYSFIGVIKPNYITDKNFIKFKMNIFENILFRLFNISGNKTRFILQYIIKKNKKLNNLVCKIENHYFLSHQNTTLALILKDIFNVKIIYDIHGLNFVQDLYGKTNLIFKQKILNIIAINEEKSIFKKADYLNVVSENMKDLITNKFLLNKQKIFVIKDGKLDFKLDNKHNNDLSFLDNKINGRFVIGFIGNFKKMGGVLNLVKAFNNLDKDHFFLLLIGNGQLEKDILNTLSTENSIHIKSIPYNKVYYYQQHVNLLVCPDEQNNIYNSVCPHIKVYDSIFSNKRVLITHFGFWDKIKILYPNNIFFTDSSIKDIEKQILDISKLIDKSEIISEEFKQSINYKNISELMVSQYKKEGILN